MPTLTIPESIIKENDLMIISRAEYENLILKQRKIPTVKMTKTQKRDLEQARKEYERGEYITLEELERELGITPRTPRLENLRQKTLTYFFPHSCVCVRF